MTATTTLTPRELLVLQLAAVPLCSKDTAKKLGVCKRTVDFHRYNLMQKLDATTIAEAIRAAVRLGLIACPYCGGGNEDA